jgi:hypothetical protein
MKQLSKRLQDAVIKVRTLELEYQKAVFAHEAAMKEQARAIDAASDADAVIADVQTQLMSAKENMARIMLEANSVVEV